MKHVPWKGIVDIVPLNAAALCNLQLQFGFLPVCRQTTAMEMGLKSQPNMHRLRLFIQNFALGQRLPYCMSGNDSYSSMVGISPPPQFLLMGNQSVFEFPSGTYTCTHNLQRKVVVLIMNSVQGKSPILRSRQIQLNMNQLRYQCYHVFSMLAIIYCPCTITSMVPEAQELQSLT